MRTNLLPYTSGNFTVRQGGETGFVAAFEAVVEWTRDTYPAALEFSLFQDRASSGRFFTLIRWEDEESIESWRADPEFGAYMTQLREHCLTVEVFTLQRVGHYGWEG